jgi:hypothetical protein
MQPTLDILDNSECNDIQPYLERITDTDIKWNKVYMSFGSKWNALTVPTKTFDSSTWYSNSLDQMVPSFIRYQSDTSYTLVIIIDEFKNQRIMNINKTLIAQNIEDTNNIRVCIVNKFCSSKEIIMDFTDKVVGFSKRHNIKNEDFIICNFVKYLNEPNLYELSTSTLISTTINDTIKDTTYKDCLYEWFGYAYGLHTLIYNRNKLHRQPYFDHSTRILKSILSRNVDGLPIHMWKDLPTSNLHVFEVLKHVCSLEAYHESSFHLNTSLYDIVKYNKTNEDIMNYMENVDY